MPPDSFTRPYVCLEEEDLATVVADCLAGTDAAIDDERSAAMLEQLKGTSIFLNLGTFVARNTEDAKRKAGKSLPVTGDVDTLEIVAVPQRNFQPGPVKVNPTNEVSVG